MANGRPSRFTAIPETRMAENSETLISRASQGDDDAFGILMERHLPALQAFIRLRMDPRLRRWETVSDVSQSVCREALKNLNRFTYRGEAAFRHWLFTAAVRKLVEKDRYHRAAKRNPELLETNAPRSGLDRDPVAREICRALGSPSEQAIGREMQERIEEALDAMSEEAREVFLMSRLAGLSNPEIAKLTGKKESAVCYLLCQTVAELSRFL
jgi:RNA polymerase sigma-70 factor, ECF subfamily